MKCLSGHTCSALPRPHTRRCLATPSALRQRHDSADAPKESSQQHHHKVVAFVLSAALALNVVGAEPARAESGFERRQNDLERRRQILAEAREKALSKGGIMQQRPAGEEAQPGAPAAPPPRDEAPESRAASTAAPSPAEAPKAAAEAAKAAAEPLKAAVKPTPASEPSPPNTEPAGVKKLKEEREKTPPLTERQEGQSVQDLIRSSLGDYDSMMKSSPKAGKPAAEPAKLSGFQQRDSPKVTEPPAEPKFSQPKALQFAKPPPTPAPGPAPASPSKAPAALPEPVKASKPGVQKLGPKPQVPAKAQARNGKVKGPLPMTLAQLVVLGIFGGITYAFTAKAEASANFVQAAVEAMISTYQKVEAAVIQRTSKDKPYVSELREPSGKDAVQPEA